MNERTYAAGVQRLRQPDRIERMEVPRVVDLTLTGIAASSLLDVGTGSGLFAEAFDQRGLSVTGIDVNPEMIRAAKDFVPKGTFIEGVLEALPFADRSFDLLFLGAVLHETDNLRLALSECRRCATVRVAVLEWPYRQEEIGPPLEHRLRDADILQTARNVGFRTIDVHALDRMDLYLLTP
jgi:ubiquinone/menaquinone biosynthesis C-methylase UbiE